MIKVQSTLFALAIMFGLLTQYVWWFGIIVIVIIGISLIMGYDEDDNW